jgi:glutaminase
MIVPPILSMNKTGFYDELVELAIMIGITMKSDV